MNVTTLLDVPFNTFQKTSPQDNDYHCARMAEINVTIS